MGAIALGTVTIALVFWGEPVRAALNEFLGIESWDVTGRRATARALGLLVLIALIVALDPEVRGFLLLINDLGLDIFLLLLSFQGREYLLVLNESVLLPVARNLANWGSYPVVLPSRWLLREHPFWGVYATLKPVAVAATIATVCVAVTWPLGRALSVFF
jgi:hypothetical protein